MTQATVFQRIVARELPADIVYEDEHCIAIKDIHPRAPVHLLVISKKPIPRLVDATEADQAVLGHMLLKVGDIARQAGVDEAFRLVVNNGEGAGQTVFHLHMHILGNRSFAESDLGKEFN